MDLIEEFHKHAADCEQMAKLTHDTASRVSWLELAERFRKCAEKNSLLFPVVSKQPQRTRESRTGARRSRQLS
jgi:hypothetical protein